MKKIQWPKRGHAFFEIAHVRRDGTVIPIELSSRIIEYKGKPAVLSIARDITEVDQPMKSLFPCERFHTISMGSDFPNRSNSTR